MKPEENRSLMYHSFAESFGLLFLLLVSWVLFLGDLDSSVPTYVLGGIMGFSVTFGLWPKRRFEINNSSLISKGLLSIEILCLSVSYWLAAEPGLNALSVMFLLMAMGSVFAEIYMYKRTLFQNDLYEL